MKKWSGALALMMIFSVLITTTFSQNEPVALKKRVAQEEIVNVAVDWLAHDSEGGGYKRIFKSSDEGDCNAIKFALEDVVPIDISPVAKVTHLGLARHGSIYILYKDGQKDQLDVSCGYGYFVGGSRAVASAFHSWGLTKWLMRVIDQYENRGRLNLYAGCFAPMAGLGNNKMGRFETKYSLEGDTPASGPASKAKLIAEGFMSGQHYKKEYEEKVSYVEEFEDQVNCYFKRKVPAVLGDGLIRVDKKTWKAEWIPGE